MYLLNRTKSKGGMVANRDVLEKKFASLSFLLLVDEKVMAQKQSIETTLRVLGPTVFP